MDLNGIAGKRDRIVSAWEAHHEAIREIRDTFGNMMDSIEVDSSVSSYYMLGFLAGFDTAMRISSDLEDVADNQIFDIIREAESESSPHQTL
ncbi:MAG: hypothetical protein OEV21_03185 [Thermoplasmata archaeon]|nr:hypothetical protein [Thermoplasmata archaeon]